jgi:hypothetical protein
VNNYGVDAAELEQNYILRKFITEVGFFHRRTAVFNDNGFTRKALNVG